MAGRGPGATAERGPFSKLVHKHARLWVLMMWQEIRQAGGQPANDRDFDLQPSEVDISWLAAQVPPPLDWEYHDKLVATLLANPPGLWATGSPHSKGSNARSSNRSGGLWEKEAPGCSPCTLSRAPTCTVRLTAVIRLLGSFVRQAGL